MLRLLFYSMWFFIYGNRIVTSIARIMLHFKKIFNCKLEECNIISYLYEVYITV